MSKNVKLLLLVGTVLVVALIIVYLAIPKDGAETNDYIDYTETSSETEAVSSESSSVSIDTSLSSHKFTALYDERVFPTLFTMEDFEKMDGTTDNFGSYTILPDKSAEEKEAESNKAIKSTREQMKVMADTLVDAFSRHKEINENLKLLLTVQNMEDGTVRTNIDGVLREDANGLEGERIIFEIGLRDHRGKGSNISMTNYFEVASAADADAIKAWIYEIMQEVLPADTYKLIGGTKEYTHPFESFEDVYTEDGIQVKINRRRYVEKVGTKEVTNITLSIGMEDLEYTEETEGTE